MVENNKLNNRDTETEGGAMPKKRKRSEYPELERVLKNLEKWNRDTKKHLDKMYKKKGNPGDDTLRILDGISKQNEVLAVVTTRVEYLSKINDNIIHIKATLIILTAIMIGLGTWIVTHI